jgi:hypothetical protein
VWIGTISRMCREFGCSARAARDELENDPEQLAVQVMEFRDYQRAKALVDAAVSGGTGLDDDARDDPMVQAVIRTQARILREG